MVTMVTTDIARRTIAFFDLMSFIPPSLVGVLLDLVAAGGLDVLLRRRRPHEGRPPRLSPRIEETFRELNSMADRAAVTIQALFS